MYHESETALVDPVGTIAPALTVRVLDDAAELARYAAAWQDLADNSAEANVFYEPWMLLPALEAFASGEQLLFVLVLDGDPHGPPEEARLCGFFPLQRRRLHRRLPLHVLGLWQYLHCYLCTPLVRADCVRATLDALFDWLRSDPRGAALMEFNQLTAAGPCSTALLACSRERENPTVVTDSWERALFEPRGDGDTYIRSVLSGKKRRSVERRARRLAETESIAYEALTASGDVVEWADEFLRLEAAGWKGKDGTALACDPANRRFFHAILGGAFARGRLLLCTLRAAGRPIAFRCSFLAGEGAFAFKMTYDEQYGGHSPGTLLELDHVRRLHALPELRWMDSCTGTDNSMMNDLWPGRRAIHTVLAASGRGVGRLVVALYPWMRALKRRLSRSADTPPPASDELEMTT